LQARRLTRKVEPYASDSQIVTPLIRRAAPETAAYSAGRSVRYWQARCVQRAARIRATGSAEAGERRWRTWDAHAQRRIRGSWSREHTIGTAWLAGLRSFCFQDAK